MEKRSTGPILALLLVAPLLAGCTGPGAFAAAAFTTVSLMSTKKLPNDLLAEYDTGLNCDTVRAIEEQRPQCVADEEIIAQVRKDRYCYRTIGTIECYSEPNPYGDRVEEVR